MPPTLPGASFTAVNRPRPAQNNSGSAFLPPPMSSETMARFVGTRDWMTEGYQPPKRKRTAIEGSAQAAHTNGTASQVATSNGNLHNSAASPTYENPPNPALQFSQGTPTNQSSIPVSHILPPILPIPIPGPGTSLRPLRPGEQSVPLSQGQVSTYLRPSQNNQIRSINSVTGSGNLLSPAMSTDAAAQAQISMEQSHPPGGPTPTVLSQFSNDQAQHLIDSYAKSGRLDEISRMIQAASRQVTSLPSPGLASPQQSNLSATTGPQSSHPGSFPSSEQCVSSSNISIAPLSQAPPPHLPTQSEFHLNSELATPTSRPSQTLSNPAAIAWLLNKYFCPPVMKEHIQLLNEIIRRAALGPTQLHASGPIIRLSAYALDRWRLLLLAAKCGDSRFLIMHQVYCRWRDGNYIASTPMISSGFKSFQSLLRDTQLLSKARSVTVLRRFATFPVALEDLTNPSYHNAMSDFCQEDFATLGMQYDHLIHYVKATKGIPQTGFLIGQLRLHSPILQRLLRAQGIASWLGGELGACHALLDLRLADEQVHFANYITEIRSAGISEADKARALQSMQHNADTLLKMSRLCISDHLTNRHSTYFPGIDWAAALPISFLKPLQARSVPPPATSILPPSQSLANVATPTVLPAAQPVSHDTRRVRPHPTTPSARFVQYRGPVIDALPIPGANRPPRPMVTTAPSGTLADQLHGEMADPFWQQPYFGTCMQDHESISADWATGIHLARLQSPELIAADPKEPMVAYVSCLLMERPFVMRKDFIHSGGPINVAPSVFQAIPKLETCSELEERRIMLDHSCLLRIRVTKLPSTYDVEQVMSEAEWLRLSTSVDWPDHLMSIVLRAGEIRTALEWRKKGYFSKSYPISISDEVVEGQNSVNIVAYRQQPGEKERAAYALAAECVIYRKLSSLRSELRSLPEADIKQRIRGILCTDNDDGDVTVLDTSVVICLRDPISRKLCKSAVRSRYCLHLDCFDLDSYLDSRNVAEPEGFCCPICGVAARPLELRSDRWLTGILEERLKSDVSGDNVDSIRVQKDLTYVWERREKNSRTQAAASRRGSGVGDGSGEGDGVTIAKVDPVATTSTGSFAEESGRSTRKGDEEVVVIELD